MQVVGCLVLIVIALIVAGVTCGACESCGCGCLHNDEYYDCLDEGNSECFCSCIEYNDSYEDRYKCIEKCH
ncbi:MAG: hypothetical protein GY861_24145 [bacterium]|nr:hypothetical protein [bacterium]